MPGLMVTQTWRVQNDCVWTVWFLVLFSNAKNILQSTYSNGSFEVAPLLFQELDKTSTPNELQSNFIWSICFYLSHVWLNLSIIILSVT